MKKIYILVILIAMMILSSSVVFAGLLDIIGRYISPSDACSDRTPTEECSITKPLYCDRGRLINNCQKCGCSSGQGCQDDGSCTLTECVEEWICSSSSECINGKQTRTCTDENNCGTTRSKPLESQSCVVNQCSDNIDNDRDGLIDYPNDSGCGSLDDNNETNEYKIFSINLKKGFKEKHQHSIALPLTPKTPYTAESMLDEIYAQGGNCTVAQKWTGSYFDAHQHDTAFGDFNIELGKGYMLECSKDSIWTIIGTEITSPLPINLAFGWNFIGIPYSKSYTADFLLKDINEQGGNCTEARTWSDPNWMEYEPNNSKKSISFTVGPGIGIFVKCFKASLFTPKVTECSEEWICSSWSDCVNGKQTRTCIDENNCGTEKNKPLEIQDCAVNQCSDGTLLYQCSTDKPKLCDNGNLVDKCGVCGCISGQECQGDGSCMSYQKVNLLIFVSPQYSNDNEIIESIQKYISAVEQDLGWKIDLIKLDSKDNTIGKIRHKIISYYNNGELKAAIMVGEDISTGLGAEEGDKDSPSVSLWSELDEEFIFTIYGGERDETETLIVYPNTSAEEIDEIIKGRKISVFPSEPEVAISLLYPPLEENGDNYSAKKEKVIKVFDKFSKERNKDYGNKVRIFDYDFEAEQGIGEEFKRTSESKELEQLGEATYFLDCDTCDFVFGEEFKAYGAFGHGTPEQILVTSKSNANLWAKDLGKIKTPFLFMGGCYATAWYYLPQEELERGESNNNKLDPPRYIKGSTIFLNEIFEHPDLRVIIGGAVRYDSENYSNFFKDLNSGLTIAEAFTNGEIRTIDGKIIFGDPTFHYISAEEADGISKKSTERQSIINTFISWVKRIFG